MIRKFLNFRTPSEFNFTDKEKWLSDGKSYLLKRFSPEKDLCITTAHIKVLNNDEDPDKLWIEGTANANIVDRMQERLDPVGLDVADYLKNRQLLAHHSYYHPIGQVEDIEVTEQGVQFKGWVGNPRAGDLTDTQKEMRSLINQGILKTVSVGFIPKKVRPAEFDDQGNLTSPTIIEKWELLELSVVAVPANQGSTFDIKTIKNSEDEMQGKKDQQNTEETTPKKEDNNLENVLSEILNLLRNVDAGVKQNAEVLKTIVDKVMGDSKPEENEDDEEKPKDDEEEEKQADENMKNIEERFSKVEAALSLIVNRLENLN